ncbi:Uncharacterised protein [Mycobacteroides abscessus subsp. abscessus]|nr:Uncharacterised protein [Mycobacteroides abscessus subsp. abscessus]
MPEVSEHRPVRLAQIHAQPLAIRVKGLGEVDGDDAVGVPDRHRPAERLARQQIESQPAVGAPERFDGQAEVDELIDQHAQIRQRRW